MLRVVFVCDGIVHVSSSDLVNEYWLRYDAVSEKALTIIKNWTDDPWAIETQLKLGMINSCSDIENWIKEHNMSWPFSEEESVLFELTWG